MRYLFDSDTLSDFYESTSPRHGEVIRRLSSLEEADVVAISILALYEFEYGCANAPEHKREIYRQRIENARVRFSVIPLSLEAAGVFGQLKKSLIDSRKLSKRGSKSHNIDLMTAATAISESCVLVSDDSLYGDLQKLGSGLKLEIW
jgi:predicted nucleic acid-binding protein